MRALLCACFKKSNAVQIKRFECLRCKYCTTSNVIQRLVRRTAAPRPHSFPALRLSLVTPACVPTHAVHAEGGRQGGLPSGAADATAALPDDVLLLMLRALPLAPLLRAAAVCARWRAAVAVSLRSLPVVAVQNYQALTTYFYYYYY